MYRIVGLAVAGFFAIGAVALAGQRTVVTSDYHPTHPSPPRPVGDPGNLVRSMGYLPDSRNDGPWDLTFQLSIAADGSTTDCKIVGGRNDPLLERVVCPTLMRWSRFIPATDAVGKPAAGTYRENVKIPTRPRYPSPPTPRGSPRDWVTIADYPSDALNRKAEGNTTFVLKISEIGKVIRCDIARSSNDAVLDAKTCELMLNRSRFNPAKDTTGNAITSTYSSTVRWRIPRE